MSKCRWKELTLSLWRGRAYFKSCFRSSLMTKPTDQFSAEDLGENLCTHPELFLCVAFSSPVLCPDISRWLRIPALLTQHPKCKGTLWFFLSFLSVLWDRNNSTQLGGASCRAQLVCILWCLMSKVWKSQLHSFVSFFFFSIVPGERIILVLVTLLWLTEQEEYLLVLCT